ncbi:MAG TPA: mechanosensitive ion channel domain-containing protein [Stenotrophomonas sp.]|jgi:small-conductance mechanosensitive channel
MSPIGWLLWGSMLMASPAWAAASAPDAPPSGTAAEATPQPVETAAIVSRADTDERLAISAIARAQAPNPGLSLAPELEVIARAVDARLQLFSPAQLRTLPIMRLESLDRHWRFDVRRYERWSEAFKLATAPFAGDVAELARRRAAWQLTQTQAQSAGLPSVLQARIQAVLDVMVHAEQALSVPLGQQVAMGARANALESRLRDGQGSVGQAIADIDRRLLRLDAPPLWRAGTADRVPGTGASAITDSLQIEAAFATAYAQADFGNQLALHALQILLLPLLLWLGRRSRTAAASGEMDASAARVLGRPWSTWLLLSMLGVLAFEPDAPVLTRQLAMLIALVPVLRLLPPGTRKLLDHWPWVATALYLLAGLGFMFLASPQIYRFYTLGLTAVSLLATAWLLWRARRRGHLAAAGGVGRLLMGTGWAAGGLLVIGLVANVVGNVSLAEMLTEGVIDCAYLGLLLYVGVTVVIILLHLLLNRPGLQRFRLTRQHAPPLVQLLTRLAIAGAIGGWVLYTLDSFRILRPLYRLLRRMLGHEFGVGDFSLSLGHVLVFVLAIVIASWASRVTRLLLQDVLETRAVFARGVGNSIASLASYAVLVLGIVVALSAAGVRGTQLALLFGALGVGIGFGLQNIVNNFVSGLILIFERPIQPGDVVEIGETQGRVRDIGMRATRIRTFDGADVVVPNGTLLSERLTNWTLLDRSRRIEVNVGVAYGSDPQQVLALLTDCAQHTSGIVSAPPVAALFDGFGASSLDFSLRAWTHDFDNWPGIRSELVTRIHAAFGQAGIEIPFPQQDVHVRNWPAGDASPASTPG